VGEPILSGDIQAAVQHYATFFEKQILEDPASWAYLADKHWQDVLGAAAALRSRDNAATD
jgi:lauroyl/myristoyl acyltransferase